MKFGVLVGAAFPDEASTPAELVSELAFEMAEAGSRSGFDAFGCAHRPIPGESVQFLHPLALAGHLLGRYPSMAVATTVLLLPYFHPVDLAEHVATLQLAGGRRLILGVGQGYRSKEADLFGIRPYERGRRLAEALEIIRSCFEEGLTNYHGEFFEIDNVMVGVRSDVNLCPPLLVAADTLPTIRSVVERGGGHWLSSARHSTSFLEEALPVYRQSLESVGRHFEGLAMTRDICVAQTRAQAENAVADSFTRYLHLQHRWGQPGERYDVEFDELKNERFILGNSEEAAAEIIDLHSRFGADFVVFRTYTPGMTRQQAIESIWQIGEEVLPNVRRAVGGSSMLDGSVQWSSQKQEVLS
jgi:alkanesulfonate monooxygenase SsuD/methylene tetrahydromethanopterin reductase-like flavin-dependent oxidoreductase (luciferase family)